MRQGVRKGSMSVNYRAGPVSVKAKDPPYGTCAPVERVAGKVTANKKVRAPEKTLVLDPIRCFAKLTAGMTRHEYLVDDPVFSQGDPAQAVFYIQSGKVRLTVRSVNCEHAVVSVLSAGSFLGECCLAGQTVRSATARSLVRGTIVRIGKQATMDMLRSDPEFADRFFAHVLYRNIRIEADLVSHLFELSEKRHAKTRGTEAQSGTVWMPIPVTAKISPESLAEKIGTTSSNVSFLLDSFRELGYIDSRGDEMLVHSSLTSVLHDGGKC